MIIIPNPTAERDTRVRIVVASALQYCTRCRAGPGGKRMSFVATLNGTDVIPVTDVNNMYQRVGRD